MATKVVFSPAARDDVLALYGLIARKAGGPRAASYTEAIVALCRGLALFPERGTRRDDIRPGLRVIGFRRRVTIAFHITSTAVTIDRVLYGGRDLPGAFRRREVR